MSSVFVQMKSDHFGMKAGGRYSVSDDDAQYLITQGKADPVTDDLITPAVAKAMESAFQKFTGALDGIVNAARKQFQDVQTHARKPAVPAIFGTEQGDPSHCFGDWCLQVTILGSQQTTPAQKSAADKLEKSYKSPLNGWSPETRAALGESSGVTGGYVVPPDFYH